MSRRITAGNDTPFRWAVTLQGKPFDLTGKDVKVYVINSRGEIPVAQLTIKGHEVSGVFEGRYQTRLGEHSLVLRVNEGRPEMKTAAVANVFELVQWSADAGGSDEGDVIVAPVLIESELSIGMGGGSSYESDVFKAIYGTTTYEEVSEAYNQGKIIHCDYESRCYELAVFTGNIAWFSCLNTTTSYLLMLNADSSWSKASYGLENTGNKVDTIQADAKPYQYPSAKAVYEALQNVGGGSDVFVAEYGVTTYNEILEAYNADKIVICKYNNVIFRLVYAVNIMHFAANVNKTLMYVRCPQSNNWLQSTENTEHKLEALDNGNAQITIAGKTAEVATPQYVDNAIQQSGTPSGDPMHYMFEAVGATYNATDEDIPMVGIYGDSYVHKARHWHLNELGDITNEEMRVIYAERYPTKTMRYMQEWFREASARTTLSSLTQVSSTQGNNIGYKAQCETMLFTADINGEIMLANLADGFYRAEKLRKILGILNMSSATAIGATSCYCPMLEYVRFKGVKQSANLSLAPMLSNASILYMIENVSATGITITLHASAYDRAMADAEIVAAMESKQVNLAKA